MMLIKMGVVLVVLLGMNYYFIETVHQDLIRISSAPRFKIYPSSSCGCLNFLNILDFFLKNMYELRNCMDYTLHLLNPSYPH